MFTTILVFLLILGFLVFVHELGHFLVARKNGIKCDEFGFGFPPRAIGVVHDDKKGKWILIKGNKDVIFKNTIYSLNWFPIGGFVKIKGENGDDKKDSDSFANKSAWARIAVLAAGVTMNFIFAWLFLSITFMSGTPQEAIDPSNPNSQIMITSIEDSSPASSMGLKPGDIVEKNQIASNGQIIVLNDTKNFQDFIGENKGQQINLKIRRGTNELELLGTPRAQTEEGKGLLGVGLTQVETVKYSVFEAFWKGLQETGNILLMMFDVLKNLLAGAGGVEVSGIVGIAQVTGQVIPMGFVAVLRLVAIFSLNLALINALPFPALDGGRVLFILIEKLKGSPVSQKIEQAFHTAGFVLLMLLMVVVTYRDIIKLDIVTKIKGLF
jgi:regulator of sigma E protease